MTTLLTFILDHGAALGGYASAAGAAAVHAYQLVIKAGGLRGIWRDLLGEKKP